MAKCGTITPSMAPGAHIQKDCGADRSSLSALNLDARTVQQPTEIPDQTSGLRSLAAK